MSNDMSIPEFAVLMQHQVIMRFCNCSLMAVEAMDDEERDRRYNQAQEYEQHRQTLMQGMAATQQQGFDAQDFVDTYFGSKDEE